MKNIIDDELLPMTEVDKWKEILKIIGKNPEFIFSGIIEQYAPSPIKAAAILPRMFRAFRLNEFWEQCFAEINKLIKVGLIKPDYFESEQGQACFQEFANATEDPSIDKVKFESLKAIYINAAKEKTTTREEYLPQIYMRAVTELNSECILVLKWSYGIFNNSEFKEDDPKSFYTNVNEWIDPLIRKGKFTKSILLRIEKILIEKGIIFPRDHNDGVRLNNCFRLTDFAKELCEFLQS